MAGELAQYPTQPNLFYEEPYLIQSKNDGVKENMNSQYAKELKGQLYFGLMPCSDIVEAFSNSHISGGAVTLTAIIFTLYLCC